MEEIATRSARDARDASQESDPTAQVRRIAELIKEKGIETNPPLTPMEAADFEKSHGISLPPGYRLFLTHIGNGADGPPDTGIAALGTLEDDSLWAEIWSGLDRVRDEFPLKDRREFDPDDPVLNGKDLDDEDEESEVSCDDLYFTIRDKIYDEVVRGTLWLGSDEDGESGFFLVVNGPERGIVWRVEERSYGTGGWSFHVYRERDFLDWYEAWLTDAAAERGA